MAARGVSEGDNEPRTESGSAVTESDSKPQTGVTESDSTVTESNSSVTLIYSHSNLKLLEDSIKRGVKRGVEDRESTATTTTTGATFKIYEQEIGALTPIISQDIQGYLEDPHCPPGYIADAIQEAAGQNKRSWAYIRAILKRWMAEGKQARGNPSAGSSELGV
jgi:DnaD/phage-associated family protein